MADVSQFPELNTEDFGKVYIGRVIKVDPVTKTLDVNIVFEDDLVEHVAGMQFFTFLTNTQLENFFK